MTKFTNKLYAYDIETYPNMYCVVFQNVRDDSTKYFEISPYKNDAKTMIKWLNSFTDKDYLIGFNNIEFDWPVINEIIKRPSIKANHIYAIAQKLITMDKKDKYNFTSSKPLVNQIDLYQLNGFSNPNMRCSLKWAEFSMRFEKIQDLPYAHTKVLSEDEMKEVGKYCYNDVYATKSLYLKSVKKVRLRQSIGKQYDLKALNLSDVNIGDNIIRKYYSAETGKNYKEFKNLRDKRNLCLAKDIISDKIVFQSKELNDLLNTIKSSTSNLLTDDLSYKFNFKGCGYEIAKGGLHSTNSSKMYKSDLKSTIYDLDFGSYYPGLMLLLKIFPPQLGDALLKVIQQLLDERLAAKKRGDKAEADGKKLSLNSIYGKLGSRFSYLFSPTAMYTVTLNGQLYLLMLIEHLTLLGYNCFYANTDGATFKIPRGKEKEFEKLAEEFCKPIIDIPLEFVEYKQCAILNVNNYTITKADDEVKRKGCFELHQEIAIHKNASQSIVQLAIDEYYSKGVPLYKSISLGYKYEFEGKEYSTDIYDFCIGKKKNSKQWYECIRVDHKGQKEINEIQDKVIRFYVSTKPSKIYKYGILKTTGKLRKSEVIKGKTTTLFQEYYDSDNYKIDYVYYIKEAQKIINTIEPPTQQLSLI
jgi:DNA polymerase elongation subunit (family B)